MSSTSNPRRRRVLHLILLGVALVGAWVLILGMDEQGMPRMIGSAGIAITLAMIAVLLYSYITRRGLGGIVAALSIASLILSIITMVTLLVLWA